MALALDLLSLRAGLWNDELTTLQFASGSFANLVDLASRDPSPPLYYLLQWLLFRVAEPGEVPVRLLSLAAHLALVGLVYRYGERFHTPRVGVLAALAVAANPMMGWYATNGRTYALTCLAGMACLYAYRAQSWRAFAVWSVIGPWLHFGAALCPALLVAFDLARRRAVTPALKAALVAALACAPLAYHFVHATAVHHPPFAAFDLAAWLNQLKWWAGLDALPGALLLVVLPITLGLVLARLPLVGPEAFLWLGSSLIAGAIGLAHGSAYHPKFILWTLPVALVALARALPDRAALPLGGLWLGAVLAGGLMAAGEEKTADRRTARWLAPQVAPHDRLVLEDGTRGAFRHYFLEQTRGGSAAPATWYVRDRNDVSGRLEVTRIEGVDASAFTTSHRHVVIEPSR